MIQVFPILVYSMISVSSFDQWISLTLPWSRGQSCMDSAFPLYRICCTASLLWFQSFGGSQILLSWL